MTFIAEINRLRPNRLDRRRSTQRSCCRGRARRRKARKRGGGQAALGLDEVQIAVDAFVADLLDLDRALERLAGLDPRQAQVVECRFFGGMTIEGTAEALGVSPRTVRNDWTLARAWLYRALQSEANR